MSNKNSCSDVQKMIEQEVLKRLSKKYGYKWDEKPPVYALRNQVQIDGIDSSNRILCEVYAHVGRLKGSQPDKVASDILKLLLVGRLFGAGWKKVLALCDSEAASRLCGESWLARAAAEHDVRIEIVKLPKKNLQQLKKAQERQRMVNATPGD